MSDGYTHIPENQSMLTEEDFSYARSEEFMLRFGDWEKANRLEKLKHAPVLEKDRKVFFEGEDITQELDDLRRLKDKKILQGVARNLGRAVTGKWHNDDKNIDVAVSMNNIDEIKHHNILFESHIEAITLIPEIIKNAVYISEEKNTSSRHPDIIAYQYFAGGIKLGGKNYTVKSVIGVDKNQNHYYDQSLSSIEKGKLVDILQERSSSKTVDVSEDVPENLSPLISPWESELPSNHYDKRLVNICQVPQLPYMERTEDGTWLPTKKAVEAVRNGTLFVRRQGARQVMVNGGEKQELYVSEDQAVRIQLARDIKANMPDLSDGERACAIAILEAGAATLGQPLADYVRNTFPNGVFGDYGRAQNAAHQQGVEINGAVSIDGFGRNVRAVIYASQTADFSTWCHELAHIWQAQLTGALKNDAEKAFQVENGNWQESVYAFEDGHADTSAEAFAYGFEDFLKNKAGEMAADDKKAIFETFAGYMSRTYNGMRQNIEISEDIAKVYERFVQLDDNILAEAEKAVRREKERIHFDGSEIRHDGASNENGGQEMPFQAAYHGSSAIFSRFNTAAYGYTGEGAMAFGWGTYLSSSENVARDYAYKQAREKRREYENDGSYANDIYDESLRTGDDFEAARKRLVGRQKILVNGLPEGSVEKEHAAEGLRQLESVTESDVQYARNLYTVEIPDDGYLDWEEPVADGQKRLLSGAVRERGLEMFDKRRAFESGCSLYHELARNLGGEKSASAFLKKAGFAGMRYTGSGATNYVIFDDGDIQIKERLQFQIVGERSIRRMAESEEKSRILSSLDAARLMDEKYGGMDASAKAARIRHATGWEKDAAGVWKYELDDSLNRIKSGTLFQKILSTSPHMLEQLSRASGLALGDIMEAPELFEMFPFMQSVRVGFYDDPNAFRAVLTPEGIKVNTRYLDGVDGEKGLKGVLAHEIQHVIQAVECSESRGVQGRSIERLYNDMMDAMKAAGERRYDYDVSSLMDGIDAYMNDFGEIEARNVARRISMGGAQRRHATLESTEDVPRNLQFQTRPFAGRKEMDDGMMNATFESKFAEYDPMDEAEKLHNYYYEAASRANISREIAGMTEQEYGAVLDFLQARDAGLRDIARRHGVAESAVQHVALMTLGREPEQFAESILENWHEDEGASFKSSLAPPDRHGLMSLHNDMRALLDDDLHALMGRLADVREAEKAHEQAELDKLVEGMEEDGGMNGGDISIDGSFQFPTRGEKNMEPERTNAKITRTPEEYRLWMEATTDIPTDTLRRNEREERTVKGGWSTVARVQFPIEALQSDSTTIRTKSQLVNKQGGIKMSDAYETAAAAGASGEKIAEAGAGNAGVPQAKNANQEKLNAKARYYYNANANALFEGIRDGSLPAVSLGGAESRPDGSVVLQPVPVRSYVSGKEFAGVNQLIAQKHARDMGFPVNEDGNIYAVTYAQAGEKNIYRNQKYFVLASYDKEKNQTTYYNLYGENAIIDRSKVPEKEARSPYQKTGRHVPQKLSDIEIDARNPNMDFSEYLGKWQAATQLGAKFVTTPETVDAVKEKAVRAMEADYRNGLTGKIYAHGKEMDAECKKAVSQSLKQIDAERERGKQMSMSPKNPGMDMSL